MALGPALYFYYSSLLRADERLSPLSVLHLLPALILLVALLFDLPLAIWTDALIVGSFTVYFLSIIRLLLSGVTGLAHLGPHAQAAYRWLLILAGLMLINLLIEIGAWIEISTYRPLSESWAVLIGILAFLTFNAFALVMTLIRAPLLEWMHSLQELRLPRPLGDEDAEQLFARWQTLVSERQLYKREEGISLAQAGRMLGVPARQISIAINRVYGGSFSQYLNDCRVKDAQRLLVEKPDLAVTVLMLEAGFATKSNFNKEFRRVSGVSPSEYRRMNTQVPREAGLHPSA